MTADKIQLINAIGDLQSYCDSLNTPEQEFTAWDTAREVVDIIGRRLANTPGETDTLRSFEMSIAYQCLDSLMTMLKAQGRHL